VQLDRGSEGPADRSPASIPSPVTATRHDVGPGRSRRELVLGLSLISLIFMVQVAIIGTWVGVSEVRAQRLYENSLTSIEQVTRIARDIAQQRILADDHILEPLPAGKAQVEHQLSRVATDLDEAESTYGPLTELPSEDATWLKAQAQLARFEKAMDAALALSRENNDHQARAKMTASLDQYADLDRTIAELIAINHLGANQAIERIQTLRRFATVGMWATGMTGLLILLTLLSAGRSSIGSPRTNSSSLGTRGSSKDEIASSTRSPDESHTIFAIRSRRSHCGSSSCLAKRPARNYLHSIACGAASSGSGQ
jgi:hypothetical protein